MEKNTVAEENIKVVEEKNDSGKEETVLHYRVENLPSWYQFLNGKVMI